MKRNERDWAGQLISWIQEAIRERRTIFEDVTNDVGIKLESGRTKFPDILLFTDKVSGIVFNGWELKFPDTRVDDETMIENALEKAEMLRSDSFVTWNGSEAIIWKIPNKNYTRSALSKIRYYPKEKTIQSRDDLSDPVKFSRNEPFLKKRAVQILYDLGQLYEKGELKDAINITGNIVEAVASASLIIIPQFHNAIIHKKGIDPTFRKAFNTWKIYEKSTLKIMASSSRRYENIIEEEVLAKFTFYNLIGRILFYLTLSENFKGVLEPIKVDETINLKDTLDRYFDSAKKIDYQAIFKPDFTDIITYSTIVDTAIVRLIWHLTDFDFRILPTAVIGNILQNLVPQAERQKFGQYFTSETISNLVVFPVVETANDNVFDPTSGTGTLLTSFYHVLKYHGNTEHTGLLHQIWGNDISHFPAILSVINLYKQDIANTNNFPQIIRDDFFNLNPGDKIPFPDSRDYNKKIECTIPSFDGIASNFPFIQQEDIPKGSFSDLFKEKWKTRQEAFVQGKSFKINERSDYFIYCIYSAFRFLKDGGLLSAITSNAWLGKEYGIQFKKFLLDNFHIKYVVRSNAEHWFSDSKVSTIYTVFQKIISNEPTKFVSINFKLDEGFNQQDIGKQLAQIENLYAEIDNCDNILNSGWKQDLLFDDLFIKRDDSVTVSVVPREKLVESVASQENWVEFFISAKLLEKFRGNLTVKFSAIGNAFRGERTGWNEMFVVPEDQVVSTRIENNFLIPYVKSPAELDKIEFKGEINFRLFVCSLPEDELKRNFPGAYNWIKKFEQVTNKNGTKTIIEACSGHKPYWYSLSPKEANIVPAINPYERAFFCYSENNFSVDQRLVAFNVDKKYNIELIAALLNSVITFLFIEMKGTSRSLGALDLNANYFKQLPVLNPDSLSQKQVVEIVKAFQPMKSRPVKTIFDEIKMNDRISFDKVILHCFGWDENILGGLYKILASAVNNRVTMKQRF